jgi:hypothetical protein
MDAADIPLAKFAMAFAFGAFFLALIINAEGTKRTLAPGSFHPISRPGRLAFLLASCFGFAHVVQLSLPRGIA